MQETLAGWTGLRAGADNGAGRHLSVEYAASLASRAVQRIVRDYSVLDYAIDKIAPCPWAATVGSSAPVRTEAMQGAPARQRQPLYTEDQRRRRDATPWTMVQGILAPVQFAVFLVSLGLVLNFLATGTGYDVATASVVVKTGVLYLIMVTGAIWEKRVFGRYLFAPAFYWEDMMSMLVLALHTAYLVELLTGSASAEGLMLLAVAAYSSYVVNAAQFVLKLRAARLQAAAVAGRAESLGWAA